jgi:hypothetical protein
MLCCQDHPDVLALADPAIKLAIRIISGELLIAE